MAEFEQLAVNARCAPEQVRVSHLANEVARAAIDGRTPGWSSRAPDPEAPEGRAVPVHNGVGLHENQGAAPAGPCARQRDSEQAVRPGESQTRTTTLENGQLLAEGEILHGQVSVGAEGRPGSGDEGDEECEHPEIVHRLRRHEP
jgi:hypothetical protein